MEVADLSCGDGNLPIEVDLDEPALQQCFSPLSRRAPQLEPGFGDEQCDFSEGNGGDRQAAIHQRAIDHRSRSSAETLIRVS